MIPDRAVPNGEPEKVTTRLAAACARPFSNGTEGDAWMRVWCASCAHDHTMHGPDGSGPGCRIIADAMIGGEPWPEAWLPEPDDDRFGCPSRMICGQYQPCDPCGGDPQADLRAGIVGQVTAYWAEHGREVVS